MTRDLFGEETRPVAAGGEVSLALVFHRDSGAAVLLSETGRELDAQWAPLSQVSRGEGPEANVWTMPIWLARDRGWM